MPSNNDHLQQLLTQQESELEEMTASIIEQQDQLIAVRELVEATREHLEVAKTVQVLANITERLLAVDALFVSLMVPEERVVLSQSPPEHWPADVIEDWHEQMMADGATEWILDDRDGLYDLLKLAHTPNKIWNALFIRSAVRKDVDLMLGLVNKQVTVQPPQCSTERSNRSIAEGAVGFDKLRRRGGSERLHKEGGRFQAPDLKLCRTLLQPTSAALANALLSQELVAQARHQAEMELAKQRQEQLLPQVFPEIDHLEGYSRWIPALEVGGDFYNYMIDDKGELIFTFGDVSGKGCDVLITMVIIHMVLQIAIQPDKTNCPASLIQFAGERLYGHFSESNQFSTVFIGQFNRHDQTLLYANAGHAPVIYVPIDGSARLLEADGPPLGVLKNSLSENHLLHLQKGDMLLIASDGLNEATDEEGNLFGYERLLRLTEQLSHSPPQAIVEEILSAIQTFSNGHPQGDDQTLMVLKVT